MSANFTPTLNGYTGQQPFRFWCQTALPLIYDDSLSYYELLNKMVVYLNNVISDVGHMESNVNALLSAYNQLQDYVNTYFDNLNVQEEINNKLDEMAEGGTLSTLIAPFVADGLPSVVGDQIDSVVASQIDGSVGSQIDASVASQIATPVATNVTSWLNENVTPVGSAVVVDESLSISGAAADAKVTGDEISDLKNAIDLTNYTFDDLATTGKVIIGTSIQDNPYYNISSPIHLSVGDHIFGETVTDNSSVTVLAACDSNGNILESLIRGVSGTKEFNYIATRDMYVLVCLRGSVNNKGKFTISPFSKALVNNILNKIDSTESKVNGYIIPLNYIDVGITLTSVSFKNQNSASITGDIISGNSTIIIVPVTPSESIYFSKLSNVYYNFVLYDDNMDFIESMYQYAGNGWNQTVVLPNNCHFLGFVLGTSFVSTAFIGKYVNYASWQNNYVAELNSNIIIPSIQYKNHSLISTNASMSDGDTLYFDVSNIKQNYVFSFTGKLSGVFSSIYMAHGKTAPYSGMFAEIDDTNIKFYRYHSSNILVNTVPHGLTISDFVTVTIELLEDETAKLILTTVGGQFTTTNRWQGSKGGISVGVTNCTLTDCLFTYYCDDYDKPLWAFGDSYFYDYAEPRWPEIVIGYDYINAMFDGYGGRQSSAGWQSLNKCLDFGTPKQIFWCLGMNDPDSSSAVNSSWNTVYTDLKAYCEENDIELILCTIPTTPTNNNNFKNAIIRSSGLRYVDVADAVGADGTGSWYNGLLGPDNLHPTAQGSKVIASRIMTDVPEMYQAK